MKKLLLTLCAVAAIAFTGCGKKIDTTNWISNFDDAKKAANSEGKKIILYFSALDSDGVSERLNENVFYTDEFKTKFTQDFVLVNVDFSNSRFDTMAPNPDDENTDQKKQELDREQLNKDMQYANLYSVQSLPTYLLLTKQGYVIADLLIDENADFDAVAAEIESRKTRTEEVDALIKTINTGKKAEVLEAIDTLYETTDSDYKILLSDFNKKYITLDKKNESGKAPKHLFALSDSLAQRALMEQDYEKTIEILEMPTKYDFLSAEDRQQVFYSVGYFMATSGSSDYAKIKDYFQKAVDADPESEHAEAIKQAIAYVDEMMAEGVSTVPAAGPAEENVVPGEPSADATVETTN
ncbi:MAG: thioredoxin family protein [Treponema sp.]|nr:thioredoxin family protein [Candidatus Treponema equifaecale]